MKTRDFFPRYWFLAFLAGGAFFFLVTYLSGFWSLLLGGIASWSVLCFFSALQNRRESGILSRAIGAAPNSPLTRQIFESSAAEPDPLAGALWKAAEKIAELEMVYETAPSASLEKSDEISQGVEGLVREQEKLTQSFHSFKEVVRDWSSGVEKASRINRSLLQLNELIANDSKKVAVDTDEAARSATDGIKSVGKEIKAMTEIKATIGSSAEVIQQLSHASEQIGDFLATITTIARKTNLLALNAGIEAARAGEHGQGFAVVASEIKTLAEASAKASGDVKHLVDDIRSKTASAIFLISTTGKIEENVNVVYSAGDVFMNIVKSIRKAGGLLGEISQALDDQRNDNELLLQLLSKINQTGDLVRERFDLVEQSLDRVQRLSARIKAGLETPRLGGGS